MQTLIVHPQNMEQLATLKAFMNALKISYEERDSLYSPEFVAKIVQGDEDIEAGRTKKNQT